MRKILFKGKEKDSGRWYEGGYVRLDDTTFCFSEDYEHAQAEGRDPRHHYIIFDQSTDWGLPNRHLQAEVDPDTVCEYIGIADKNKKPIFEGDIVQITNNYRIKGVEKLPPNRMNLYLVEYRDGGFVASQGEMFTPFGSFNEYCSFEVVGNAIDNPDLLGKIPQFTPEGFMQEVERQLYKDWKAGKADEKTK